MDTITHTVIGICAGELIAGKQLGKKAMLWGGLANNIPDIDVAAGFWLKPPDSLLAHRGFAHSILFGLLVAPLLAYIFKRLYKNKPVTYFQWLLIFGSGIFIHILIDASTTYGTGWSEPFSHWRISFNSLFIIDPIFSLPVLIGAIVILLLKKNSIRRRTVATWALAISSIYFIVADINKLYVDNVVEKSLAMQHIQYDNYMAAPTPLNDVLWYIIARDDSVYYVGYYSLFDANDYISYHIVHRNDSLLSQVTDKTKLQKFIRFSDGYYTVSKADSAIVFSDMRFGQDGGWFKNDAPFAFNFVLQDEKVSRRSSNHSKFRSANKEGIIKLLKRIEGIDQLKGI